MTNFFKPPDVINDQSPTTTKLNPSSYDHPIHQICLESTVDSSKVTHPTKSKSLVAHYWSLEVLNNSGLVTDFKL